jgi:hypothetical protein
MTEKQEAKLQEIDDLIEEDISNGKHIQRKLHENLKSKGVCVKKFCTNLKKLKKA